MEISMVCFFFDMIESDLQSDDSAASIINSILINLSVHGPSKVVCAL